MQLQVIRQNRSAYWTMIDLLTFRISAGRWPGILERMRMLDAFLNAYFFLFLESTCFVVHFSALLIYSSLFHDLAVTRLLIVFAFSFS